MSITTCRKTLETTITYDKNRKNTLYEYLNHINTDSGKSWSHIIRYCCNDIRVDKDIKKKKVREIIKCLRKNKREYLIKPLFYGIKKYIENCEIDLNDTELNQLLNDIEEEILLGCSKVREKYDISLINESTCAAFLYHHLQNTIKKKYPQLEMQIFLEDNRLLKNRKRFPDIQILYRNKEDDIEFNKYKIPLIVAELKIDNRHKRKEVNKDIKKLKKLSKDSFYEEGIKRFKKAYLIFLNMFPYNYNNKKLIKEKWTDNYFVEVGYKRNSNRGVYLCKMVNGEAKEILASDIIAERNKQNTE